MLSFRRVLTILFYIHAPLVTSAQTCNLTFSGKVLGTSGEILSGATIFIDSSNGVIVDESGNFSLINICPGDHQVVVQYVGYGTVRFTVSLAKPESRIITMQPEVKELQEVIVRDAIQNADHAKNFSILSEKQLAESAGKSLGESLKEVTGVNTIQAGPGIFKPVIHGVHSQRVLILNHGIRQEGQQWGAEHAPEIDPFIASNIVVVKDASSIKYGTDALGGVVIVNPAPLPEAAGLGGSITSVIQTNGRAGTFSGMLEGGIKNKEGWGWRVQGTTKRTGDFHTPDYSLTNTGIKEFDFSLATGYHNDRYGLEVFFSRFQSEIGILRGTAINNLDDLENAMEREPPQYTTKFSYAIDEPKQAVSHNLFKVNSHIDVPKGQIRIQYGFQQNNRREYDIRMGNLAGVPSIDLQLLTHTLETEWETISGKTKSLCFGITGMYQANNNIFGTQQIPFIPNFTSVSSGAYGITKIELKSWTIDAGVRYDFRLYNVSGFDFKNTLFTSELKFHNVSATAGASRTMKENQTISFSINSAWRPPHVAELYSLGTHQSAAANEYGLLLNDSSEVMNINDVSFQNEQALKVVGSYVFSNNKTEVEVTPFVNYIFNYIFLQPRGITKTLRGVLPYFRYTQTDALFIGLDVAASRKLNNRFSVATKASLLRASDVSQDDYLVFIPSNRFDVTLRYEGESPRQLYVESKVRYTARQHRSPRVITPQQFREANEQGVNPLDGDASAFDFMPAPNGYALISLSSGFSLKQKSVRYDFRLSVENLLNTAFREYTNRFRYYADDLGRNISLTVKCRF
jgi:iron complex outermembrane recepter protein